MDPETRVSYRRFSTLKIFNIVGIVLDIILTKKKVWMKDIQGLVYHCFKKFRVKVIYKFFENVKRRSKLKLLKKFIIAY